MMKSLRLLSFAALLTTGTAAMSMAATDASQEIGWQQATEYAGHGQRCASDQSADEQRWGCRPERSDAGQRQQIPECRRPDRVNTVGCNQSEPHGA